MTLKAYSYTEYNSMLNHHEQIGGQIMNFINDIGEECDVILEFDDPDDSFTYLFSGTTYALVFDDVGIHLVNFNLNTNDEDYIEFFNPNSLNRAVYCLLTLANQAKPSS